MVFIEVPHNWRGKGHALVAISFMGPRGGYVLQYLSPYETRLLRDELTAALVKEGHEKPG